LLINRPDGTTWVLLLNGRSPDAVINRLRANGIDSALHGAVQLLAVGPQRAPESCAQNKNKPIMHPHDVFVVEAAKPLQSCLTYN